MTVATTVADTGVGTTGAVVAAVSLLCCSLARASRMIRGWVGGAMVVGGMALAGTVAGTTGVEAGVEAVLFLRCSSV